MASQQSKEIGTKPYPQQTSNQRPKKAATHLVKTKTRPNDQQLLVPKGRTSSELITIDRSSLQTGSLPNLCTIQQHTPYQTILQKTTHFNTFADNNNNNNYDLISNGWGYAISLPQANTLRILQTKLQFNCNITHNNTPQTPLSHPAPP